MVTDEEALNIPAPNNVETKLLSTVMFPAPGKAPPLTVKPSNTVVLSSEMESTT